MYKVVDDQQIEAEAKAGFKPLAIDSGISPLPFSELGDREFELLSYLLIKEEIDNGSCKDFSSIALMQGVGERGRDCVLYKENVVSGVIQCKKIKARITKPAIIKEIIKFILFAILDENILPNPKEFEYKLFVANDLTEGALALFNLHPAEIKKEFSNNEFSDYIKQVANDYESFSKLRSNLPVDKVKSIFGDIKLTYLNQTDLSEKVYKNTSLVSLFFKVMTVVDLDGADKLIRNALDDYGLKFLTDNDLKLLQKRIGHIKEENRVNLGFVDFFGYNKEFFKYLKKKDFNEIITSMADIKSKLDRKVISFVNTKIHDLVLSKITNNLLKKRKIHPFSVSVAAPYLLKRTMGVIFDTSISSAINPANSNSTIIKSKKEVLEDVSHEILTSSERVMNGDISHLAGNPADIEYKKRIYQHIHKGFRNIEDARLRLGKDMKLLQPVLDEIEVQITDSIQEKRTVVIKDASFFTDPDQIERLIYTLDALDNK